MTSRRNVVSRAVVAIAGLVGLGAAGASARSAAPASAVSSFVLHGRRWRTTGRRDIPVEGDRISVRGELTDAKGELLGDFVAAGFAVGGGTHPAHGERLELHTFTLRDGTIIGSGTAGQLDGVFAILGGTGRYASARGTYVARQRHQDLGGDGTAEFEFTLAR
jgi:hypothetical protein